MGVLTARGIMGPDGPGAADVSEAHEAPEPGGTDTPEKPAPEEKGEFVPFSQVERTRKPGSRRERAAAEVEELISAKLKPLEDGWKSDRTSYEQRISQHQQEVANLRGQLEAIQRMPPAPAPLRPEAPDPDKLMQEAEKALDEKDIRKYHEKVAQAVDARAERIAERRMAAMRQELQAQIPQQLPPEIQFLMSQHRNVAMAGPQGIEAVMIKDKELQLYRVPPGPQRMARAFELADKFLASVNGQQAQSSQNTFDRSAATALSTVPVARQGGGGGGGKEDGVTLTPLQLETVRNLGWTKEEYVKWLHPERHVKR